MHPPSSTVLTARNGSVFGNSYEISAGDEPLCTLDSKVWSNGGTFTLDGTTYTLKGNVWGSQYGLSGPGGEEVARADHLGSKRGAIVADGRSYEFERKSRWKNEQALVSGGEAVGTIARRSMWKRDVVAELPGDMPLPLAVFALAVMVSVWDGLDATTAATAAAAGSTAAVS